MDSLAVADTPLANWLNERMAQWQDPETRVYGLSQNQLRERSGVSQTSVWEILKQGHTPKPDVLIRLAEFFDVSPVFLFRLAYLPESEGFTPEVLSKLDQLERILARMPRSVQLLAVDSLIVQARALKDSLEEQGAGATEEGESTD
jgi:transcriptional regulator with XRE-family HTH domain